MKKNKKNTIIWLFAIMLLIVSFSCEKYIDMEITDKGRKPVVNAILIADSIPIVKIFQSMHILDNKPFKKITDAQVRLIINGQSKMLLFDSLTEVYTDTNIILQPFSEVTVDVQTGFGNAKGKTVIPVNIPILSIDTVSHYSNEGNYDGVEIRLRFSDVPNEKNYYMISFKSSTMTPTFEETNDPGFDYFYDKVLISDFAFDGKVKTIKLICYRSIDYYFQTGTIEFFLFHLDESLYKYQLSFNKQQNTSASPFSEPVIVFNNIVNGYGICGSANVSKVTINL
ncbi:MAG: DUF4249 domain-containing protein [Bacteroidales bacterium]|nr:DUF4249 domain-containing protein [Bacteroidales bacterium]